MPFLDIFSRKPVKKQEKPKITVDHREKNSLVISELSEKNIHIEFKQLPVADYLINNTAIERKTISDLKSSIINKRIFTQLNELKQYKNHFLILEGISNESIYEGIIHENAFRGFLLSVLAEHQVPIIFTQNEKDTAGYLAVLANKKNPKEIPIRPSKTIRSEFEQARFILEGFPNIGPKTAKKLLKNFKSLKNILDADKEELKPFLGKNSEKFTKILNKQHKTD